MKHLAILTAMMAVKNMKFIRSEKSMNKIKGMFHDDRPLFQVTMEKKIREYMDLMTKSQNDPYCEEIQEIVKKYAPYQMKEAGAFPGRSIAIFEGSIRNELQIDTNWMPVYNMETAENAAYDGPNMAAHAEVGRSPRPESGANGLDLSGGNYRGVD